MRILFITIAIATLATPLCSREPLPEGAWIEIARDLSERTLDGCKREDWSYTLHHARLLATRCSETPYAADAWYYVGVAYYYMKEYGHAARAFSTYLDTSTAPKFFEEALLYKFDIATQYEKGQCSRLFGKRYLPKFRPEKANALEMYDEIIAAMPREEVAIISTFRKGRMLGKMRDFKLANETFETLIRRYPKHPLAIEAYIAISELFLKQAHDEFPDGELVERAKLNAEKFARHFPGESRIEEAEAITADLQETVAASLYELADFYVRTKKPRAATIYFATVMKQFPTTSYAEQSKEQLANLKETFAEIKRETQEKRLRKGIVVDAESDPIVQNDAVAELIDPLVQ
jgi:outer membrane protein assembly factor BamD (BamD/ComL family)